MYQLLAGMTGTAETEAEEFKKIYNLSVVVVPTHMPMIRDDFSDVIYKTEKEKFNAVASEIKTLNQQGRPVLVGTTSIAKTELVSKLLLKYGVKHNVLNAKNHEKEAEIIAGAGQRYAVTISTNMAGRGTDIVLGEGVANLGGLHVMGTERHEARRIDNQLRGRSGRQGDMGSSRFFLSLEDDLLRVFGGERISNIMDKLGMEENIPIEHGLISRAIENAQKRVEGHNFDIRKHLLRYDDVMNQQRKIIYGLRKNILVGNELAETVKNWIYDTTETIINTYTTPKLTVGDLDRKALKDAVLKQYNITLSDTDLASEQISQDSIYDMITTKAFEAFDKKRSEFGNDIFQNVEKIIILQAMDITWKEHLHNMDHLRESVSLRGYAQKDPLLEYQKEGFAMFEESFEGIKETAISNIYRIQIKKADDAPPPDLSVLNKKPRSLTYGRQLGNTGKVEQTVRVAPKVGRNDLCPCGSGKKYKKCHGS